MFTITDDNRYILVQAIRDNKPLDNFDTSKVTNMKGICYNSTSFNQPLDNFDTRNARSMLCMFQETTSMFIGYIMRFAAKSIFVFKKYEAMEIEYKQFSNSSELDEYITHLHDIKRIKKNKAKIDSALDWFVVD